MVAVAYPTNMSEVSKNERLIHALLDGELDEVRAQEVRKTLATDQQLSQCYQACLAQRAALASLTRFTLPEDFSGRVLQAAKARQTAALPSDSLVGDSQSDRLDNLDRLANESNDSVLSTARPKQFRWQIAATALASSAATLLLSMFLLPTDQTGQPVNATIVHRSVSPETEGGADPILSEVSDSLLDDDAMAASALAEPPIEQVWLLEAQDNQSGAKLASTLAANSIRVPAELSGEKDDELIDTLDQGINGILIEASAIQMKKALLELADSEQFEISAFTLPGHEAYFTDIRQAKTSSSDVTEDAEDVVASADQLAAEAMAAVTNRVEGRLMQPPVTMAQQLRQRRFSKKKAAPNISDRKKNLFADGLYSDADGPEGLGASAAAVFGIDESPADESTADASPALKQNVEALFPENHQSTDPKGSYLLLIRSPSQ